MQASRQEGGQSSRQSRQAKPAGRQAGPLNHAHTHMLKPLHPLLKPMHPSHTCTPLCVICTRHYTEPRSCSRQVSHPSLPRTRICTTTHSRVPTFEQEYKLNQQITYATPRTHPRIVMCMYYMLRHEHVCILSKHVCLCSEDHTHRRASAPLISIVRKGGPFRLHPSRHPLGLAIYL